MSADTCVYILQIFPVTGFRHLFCPGALPSICATLPLTHMHTLSCQSRTPQILQQLTLDPSLFLQQPSPSAASLQPVCPIPVPRPLCRFAGQSSLVLHVVTPRPAEAHALLCWHHRPTGPCDSWSESVSCRYWWTPKRGPRESCKRRLTVWQDRQSTAGRTYSPTACSQVTCPSCHHSPGFSMLVSPQDTVIFPFPHLWFLP